MAIKSSNFSNSENEEEEEAGEEIESAPPMKIGDEREVGTTGIKKKLLKSGRGLETPDFKDEATVHYLGTLVVGTQFDSSRDKGEPLVIQLGQDQIVKGLDHGIVTMRKGEIAMFNLGGSSGKMYEVELISWNPVVDVCKDGGIMKKVVFRGEKDRIPGDLDEVTVTYEARLEDGTVVGGSLQGVEFYVKDGLFCPAISKAVRTMKQGEKAVLTVAPQYAFCDVGRDPVDQHAAVPANATLTIELELISLKRVVDITNDSGVIKKIMKEGEGLRTPNDGATVHVKCTGYLEDGTIFEKVGFNREEGGTFMVDEEQVILGLDRTFSTMKKGEQVTVSIKPNYGFGDVETKRDLGVVPANSTLVYDIEMFDFTRVKEPWEMDNKEKLEASGKSKEEGNAHFKSGLYHRAAKKYTKATDYLNETTFEDDQEKTAKALRISCWLNKSACSLKLNDYAEAISLCSKVLDVESQNLKALFRRAQGYMATSDLELTEKDLKKALEVDPGNREVKSIYKTLKQKQLESNKRDAKFYTKMFADVSSHRPDSKRQKVEHSDSARSEGGTKTV